jgi:hypothetical protein
MISEMVIDLKLVSFVIKGRPGNCDVARMMRSKVKLKILVK